MAYLHCHTRGCNWSQDDFWSPSGYHPLRPDYIQWLINNLFEDQSQLHEHHGENVEYITGREVVARELEQIAKIIRNMDVATDKEWQQVKTTWKCPRCKQSNWDID